MVELQEVFYSEQVYRGLWPTTMKLFGFGFANNPGDPLELATYLNAAKEPIGQKCGDFTIGDITKEALPWGAHLWPKGGRMLVVTDSELNAMSMSQAQDNRWPVVSIACGVNGEISRYFATHRSYFSGFEAVILMFASDTAGNAAALTACESLSLPYGRVKLASLPLRDPNAMLVAGRERELVDGVFRAVPYRPAGFVDIGDIADSILKGPEMGEPWPWPSLTAATFGRRRGEIYTLGAGTGIGKTSTWLQVGAEIIRTGSKVGFILFENSQRDAGLRIAAAYKGKPFFVPDGTWTIPDLKASLSALTGKCLLYDTSGADWDSCASMMRYWAGAEDVQHVVLDHLSAFSAEEEDDRKALDRIMSQLAKLVAELQITVYLITHLRRPMGETHEEGARVKLDQLRGSNAIGMFSHFVFGLERNQQDSDEYRQHDVTLRVLKDRMSGRGTGKTIKLHYDTKIARLIEPGAEGFRKLEVEEEEDLF